MVLKSADSQTTAPTGAFDELGLRAELVASLNTLGYEEPTPVQRESIPLLLEGRDILSQAGTGTGKTAAFALPMLQRIADSRPARRKPGEVSGVVLVPTRELAMQVAEAVHKYGKTLGASVLPLYGGAPMHQQVRALQRGVDVVVGTPGRVLDHIRRETLKLAGMQILVLDEADEMLDMGFSDDLDAIFAALPEDRQTALFSATMPPRILQITKRHQKDPARVTIESEKLAKGDAPRVRQVAYVVTRAHKPAALARIIDMEDPVATLVFCRTRLEVESLVETFNAHGQRAEALHGGMEQRQRDKVMGLFRSQKADVLIATDVAARGLDITHITHVVNYDVPASAEVYLHRIGRTGRAGRAGTAITLVETREHRWLKSLERTSKSKIEIAQIPTVADLRAKHLDVTRASLREALLAGGHDGVRVVVESLAQEFDIVAIATTAVALLHAASAAATEDHEIPTAPPPRAFESRDRDRGPGRPERRPSRDDGGDRPQRSGPDRSARRGTGEPMARLWIGAGRQAGVRPADLVGAISGETGLKSAFIGGIEIADRFSLVEVPEEVADDVIAALAASKLRGQKVTIRRDRDAGAGPGRPSRAASDGDPVAADRPHRATRPPSR
ncbi:MAG: DEAD/DEAH box helicase [Vicinamibacteraceae bacterium]